jgi:hypothetical protein
MRVKAIVPAAAVLLLAVMFLAGCSSSPSQTDPRKVVISMFGAMEKNDQAALARLLDLPALMNNTQSDYAMQTDSPRVFTSPKQILDDLTDNGATKQRWFSFQRIVNTSQINGDHATVEVTFVDKATSKAYMTKFGLLKTNGKWRIYSFNTETTPPESGADSTE